MCGRIIQATGPMDLAIVDALDARDHRLNNFPRRYNGAPSQELPVIRQTTRRASGPWSRFVGALSLIGARIQTEADARSMPMAETVRCFGQPTSVGHLRDHHHGLE